MSDIQHHTDLHPSSNVFLTSWFILSVLFLTGDETFVVTTHVYDSLLDGPPPWYECLPVQLVHSVCVVFDRRWDICGIYMGPGSPFTWTSTLVGKSS